MVIIYVCLHVPPGVNEYTESEEKENEEQCALGEWGVCVGRLFFFFVTPSFLSSIMQAENTSRQKKVEWSKVGKGRIDEWKHKVMVKKKSLLSAHSVVMMAMMACFAAAGCWLLVSGCWLSLKRMRVEGVLFVCGWIKEASQRDDVELARKKGKGK